MTTNHIFVFNSICPLLICTIQLYFWSPLHMLLICSHISMHPFVPIFVRILFSPVFPSLFYCASSTCASPAAVRQFDLIFLPNLFVLFLCPQLPDNPQAVVTRFLCESCEEYSPLKYSWVTVTGITTVVWKWKAQHWTCFLCDWSFLLLIEWSSPHKYSDVSLVHIPNAG